MVNGECPLSIDAGHIVFERRRIVGFRVPTRTRVQTSHIIRPMHRFERWRSAIQAASDETAVGRVVRDYVKTIPESLIKALPDECQRAIKDPDIQASAVTILHCELAFIGDRDVAQILHEVAHTYAAASLRIARLSKGPQPGG
jgi:hypothetical protein